MNKSAPTKTEVINNNNRINILQLIRNNKEITRAEIIKQTGLSAPTVTRIVENLLNKKLIKYTGVGKSIGGRKPQILQFNAKNNFVIGIDIGGTYIRSALSNLDGEFVFQIDVTTDIKAGFEGVMKQVGKLIKKLTDRAEQRNFSLFGIGVAVCGMVNKNTGFVEYSPIFNWENVNIKDALTEYTSLTITFGNVVHLIALGELLYGVGKNYNNFICVNFGYGIGSGIIINRNLFYGSDGIAGEIGHVIIDRNSTRKGLEGLTGTLEALASGYSIADIAKERRKSIKSGKLASVQENYIDAKMVFDLAKHGDSTSNDILNEVAEAISVSIDTLIKLFNTESIVLSGGLIENSDLLINKINQQLPKYSMKAISRKIPIHTSSFGENAALMGAFSLILEKILNFEKLN